ncbi:hypothetical protein F5146DRAFT_1069648 [Armillaria mellea]|nr:hypothetical protein F5146DRAFT_1069648 [Armillaria mellea]
MSLFILSLTLFATTALALDATDANDTTSLTPLVIVVIVIALVFITVAATLVLFVRSWDSIKCCNRRQRAVTAKTASRRRHFGGVAVELREPRYPPPTYTRYQKTGDMV